LFEDGNVIKNIYAADGRKLSSYYVSQATPNRVPIEKTIEKVIVPDKKSLDIPQPQRTPTITDTEEGHGTHYIGNIEYLFKIDNGEETIEKTRIHNAEGYFSEDEFFYYRKDHLGNNREVWNASTQQIVQRTNYYPSGLPWASNPQDNSDFQPYKYGGKEFVEMFGLDEYDSQFRYYYPAIGRTPTMDAHAENYYHISPYAWVANRFIIAIDPDGRDVRICVTGTRVGTTNINLYSSSERRNNPSLNGRTTTVPVYEVQLTNESGCSATYYFTRTGYRGQANGTTTDVTFDVRNDQDEFLGVIRSRWGGTDNVLELRDINNINNQSVNAMKGDVEAIRTAIQFHVMGATDGCLLNVGINGLTIDEGVTIDKTDLKNSSSDTQNSFMQNIKLFQREDQIEGKGTSIIITFDKLNNSNNTE